MSAHALEEILLESWPARRWRDVGVLIAVSGGADSVALLRALTANARRIGAAALQAAHFNHHLRPEADDDEAFVRELCQTLELPLDVGHGQLHDRPSRQGLESVARTARYAFLRQTAELAGARYVLTAHTADDQAETVLHRIVRGAGLAGLSGMPRVRRLGPAVSLVRPLLDLSRSQLLDYLQALGQSYCDDATNLDARFTRNRIRHELLPQLKQQYNPRVDQALLRLARLAGEAQTVLDEAVAQLMDRCVRQVAADEFSIDCRDLAGQAPLLTRELLVRLWRDADWPRQAMGFSQWNDLAALALDSNGQQKPRCQMFPGGVAARKRGHELVLTRTLCR